MSRPKVLFFARGYQADFFPTLPTERFEPVFATLTRAESAKVRKAGFEVAGCFEDEFERIEAEPVAPDYLLTSFVSDRFLGRFGHEQRQRILGKQVRFWARLLDTHRPAAVVNELVAIEISEVLLIECRRRQVPYLAGMNCVVEDYFYWLPEPLSLSGRYLTGTPEPGPEAWAAADAYLQEVRQKDYKPFYVRNLRGRLALLPLAVAIAKLGLWSWRGLVNRLTGRFAYEAYDDEYRKKVVVYARSLYRRYDSLATLPRGAEVIFYPLHQEPEATLNYMSEFYSNQVATLENILKCMTPGQVLVVKEHPVDKGSLLRDKFWDLRRQYSSLYFLPAEVHGREVLAAASRIVTLTSTLGWEAAVLGKPVYVLGQIFYDSLPGLRPVRNFDDLRAELRAPVRGDGPDAATLRRFVAEMTQRSYRGNPFPFDQLYSSENRARVAAAIAHAAGI